DVNNAGVAEGMSYTGVPLDHALSAFIEDVEARGLSEKILLVCCGEMGRTPKLRSEEHTSELQSLTNLVCRLLLEKKKKQHMPQKPTQIGKSSSRVDPTRVRDCSTENAIHDGPRQITTGERTSADVKSHIACQCES